MTKDREEVYISLENEVGNTSLHKINNIEVPNNNRIFAKEELLNPTESLFDRVYPYLFKIAEEKGYIVPGITPVIEASSGNAGASFAWAAQKLGYNNSTVIIHEDAPNARIEQIKSYGSKIILSPSGQYAKGFIGLLEEILEKDKEQEGGKIGENPKRMYCVTKINPSSKKALEKMAEESIAQVPGKIDILVWAVCSGTTISGLGEKLKKKYNTYVVAIEHESTNVLNSFKEGKTWESDTLPHELYGSAPFGVSKDKLDINFDVIDEIVKVNDNDWQRGMELLEKEENKLVGRSSGAAFSVSLKLAEKFNNKNILTVFFDPKWKYEDHYLYFK